jgi:hypothetical protein
LAGYSGTALPQKLGLKATHRLQLRAAPRGFRALLAPLPAGVKVVSPGARAADCIILVATSAAALQRAFAPAAAALPPDGMLWIAWPKKAAKVATDVTEQVVRRIGLGGGLVDVKVCAISDVWSGLKFVRRLRDQ